MALDVVYTGLLPNDGTGDPLRIAFTTLNDDIAILNELLYINPSFDHAYIGALTSATADITGILTVGNGTINATDEFTGTARILGGLGVYLDAYIGGDLHVNGNMVVSGTMTSINTVDLTITDKNITLASGAITAGDANGGGITIAGAAATLTYTSSDDRWNLNKNLNVTRIYGTATNVSAKLSRGTYITSTDLFVDYDGSAATTWRVDATDAATASKVVARDAAGSFSANVITASLSGTATNAVNAGITNDVTTNASKYITWVDNNSGNNPLKTSSTELYFNPLSGMLSAASITVLSTGTLTSGTGAVTLNGDTTVSGSKTFSTGTGNVSINGNIITAIAQTGANTFSTGTGNVSINGNVITNITQTGATTFGTGTGAVSLNGSTTVTGSGTFSTGTGNVSINGNIITAIAQTGANTFSTGTGNVSINGNVITNITQTGATTFSTGTGAVSLNGNVGISANNTFTQSGSGTFGTGTGAVSLNGNTTIGTGKTLTLDSDPTLAMHAATKQYVDNAVVGLDVLASAKVTSTVDIPTLSGLLTIDSVLLIDGDRVLVKNQTAPATNGIYVAHETAWTRATDSNTWDLILNAYVWVQSGTTQSDTGWVSSVHAGGTLDVTAINYEQFSAASTIIAGAGLTKTANTLDIVGTTNRILVNADSIDIHGSYVGQSSITTVGTLTSGTIGSGFTAIANSALAYSSITIGTTSISLGGTSTTLGGIEGITFGTGAYSFNQSTSSGTFSTGTGTVTLNGDTTISGSKTFSTGTGNVSINGNIVTAITQTGATTFSTGTGNVSINGNIVTNIIQTGATTFGTGTGAVSFNGNTSVTGSNTFSTGTGNVSINGNIVTAITQTGATTFSTGTGAVSLNGNTTIGTGKTLTLDSDPTLDMHAANKRYVDTVAHGLDAKSSVKAASTTGLPSYSYYNGSPDGVNATITATSPGALTLDGQTLALYDRALIKNETSAQAAYNGIYLVTTAGDGGTAFVLTRATDFDTWDKISGGFCWIETGPTYGTTSWACTNSSIAGTMGSTPITFSQFGGVNTLVGSSSISLAGNIAALTAVTNPNTATTLRNIDIDTQGRATNWSTAVVDFNTVTVPISKQIGSPTLPLTLGLQLDRMWSSGAIDGAAITNNGDGTVNVASSNTMLRSEVSVSSITRALQVVTVTTAVNHSYTTGNRVRIRGAVQTGYNGIWYITVTGLNTFTYTCSETPVSPGTGTIISIDESAPLYVCTVPAVTNLALIDHAVNFVCADWNAGSPRYFVTTDKTTFFGFARAVVWQISREGNTLWIFDQRGNNIDSTNKLDHLHRDTSGVMTSQGGSIMSSLGGRTFQVTSGSIWLGTNRLAHPAFNTVTPDTFTATYTADNGTTWTYVAGQTSIDNTYYNNVSTGLASLSTNNYGVAWVYLMYNNPSSLMVVYGQGDYTKSQAYSTVEPSVRPAIIAGAAVLLGRIIIKQGASGLTEVTSRFISQFPNVSPTLDYLADVTTPTPNLNDVLSWNGIAWVNSSPVAASAGPGVNFYNATPIILATGTNNANLVGSLSHSPVTSAEQTIATNVTNNTLVNSAWISSTTFGTTTLPGGSWSFGTYAGVNVSNGSHHSYITRNVMDVVPGTGTAATTRSGSSASVVISGGTPFVAGDASATNTTASYLQTPQGLYQITAYTDDHTVTIAVPVTYANEATVAFKIWRKLFDISSANITSITPSYALVSYSGTQNAFTVGENDYLGVLTFATGDNTTTVTIVYNGTTHNSYLVTPFTVLHNDLPGLQGGQASQYYHLTSTEYTGTGTGVFVRTSGPTLAGTVSGTYTLGGSPTIGAATLAGTISGGGNQLNNVVIGTTTPLAGSFTDISASSTIHAGDVGTEGAGINIGGTTYAGILKASDLGGTAKVQLIAHRHSTTLEPYILGARSNTDDATHAAVTAGQKVLTIAGSGSAGTNYKLFGSISIAADITGTIDGTSSPGSITLNVTPDGTIVPAAAVTITNDKKVAFAGAINVTGAVNLPGVGTSGIPKLGALGAVSVATVDVDYLTPGTAASTYVPFTAINDISNLTGFINNSAIASTYNYTNRTITLTGTLVYYWRGVKHTLTSPWTSPTGHTNSAGIYYLSSTDGTNFTWSPSVWAFTDLMVAYVNRGASNLTSYAIRETHGLMDQASHTEFHIMVGTYRTSGGNLTAGTYLENSAVDADITPGFDAAVIHDEDLTTTVTAWLQDTYTTMYIGASLTPVFNTAATFPFVSLGAGTYMQVNNTATGAMTAGVNNRFYNVYQILLPTDNDTDSLKYRMIMLQPQATYTSLALAQAEDPRNLVITAISTEYVIYARITYQTLNGNANTGKCLISTGGITYLTGSKISQTNVVGFVPTNHAGLTNLGWTASGHLGTALSIPSFDSLGGATELTVTGTGTVAVLNASPTIDIIRSSTSSAAVQLWDISLSTGSISIGGGLTSGNVNIANGTTYSGTVNIASGAGVVTTSRTLNLATGGTTAVTNVNIGSTVAAGVTTINSPIVVGAGVTQALWNTVATTINAYGVATAINIAAAATTAVTETIGGATSTVVNVLKINSNTDGGATLDSVALASGKFAKVFPSVAVGTISIGEGLTTGSLNLATTGSDITNIGIGHTNAISTITGTVNLPTVGTSGFVKLGTAGVLSADTNTYQISGSYAALAGLNTQTFAVAAATAIDHAVRVDQVQTQAVVAYTTAGTNTAYTITTLGTPVALTTNERFHVIFNDTAGVAPTLNRDAKGAKALKYYDTAGAKAACGATTITANMRSDVVYDGTDYVVLNQLPVTASGGFVTAISIASSNGLAGTSGGGATPILTLSTSITGVLKGNGTAISAAAVGTDYSVGTGSLSTGILKSTTTSGALSIAVGTDLPAADSVAAGTPSVYPSVTTGSITIGAGLTSGNLNLASTGTGVTNIAIGHTNSISTITGTVNLPTVGTSGFVKLGTAGILSADTNTYSLNNQTMYIGTTSVAINRASADLSLTGISGINNTTGSDVLGLWANVTTGDINIGDGLTTGNLHLANLGTGVTNIAIGHTNSISTITGTVNLPTVGTSGFVKLGTAGILSADTNTYQISGSYAALAGLNTQTFAVAAATAIDQAVRADQIQTQALTAYTTGGTSTAYTITTLGTPVALTTNERFNITFHATAGATPTLNRDSKGAKSLKYYDSTGAKVACGPTNILANIKIDVIYDGTDYVVVGSVGGGAGGLTPTAIKTSAYNAVANDLVRVNSTGGSFTITLPASPADGDKIGILDIYNQCATNPVLFGANTKTVEGDATGLSVNINGAYFILLYDSATTNWKIEITPTLAYGGDVNTTAIQTLTNKRISPRVGSTASSATPTINTDNYDIYRLTAQTTDITSFTTNLTGSPVHGQKLIIEITGTAARAITWGASFEASTVALPLTTVTTAMLQVGFMYNSATPAWRCMGAA